MAALVACESLLSYSTDVCVAPFTTRWVLLDERVASSSCRSSQPGSDAPAVTTASGLFPRLPGLPVLNSEGSPALPGEPPRFGRYHRRGQAQPGPRGAEMA